MVDRPFRELGSERAEVELLRALLTLANQLQTGLDLDAVGRVVASAASETFGFAEAGVLVRREGDRLHALAAVGGEQTGFEESGETVPVAVVEPLLVERHRIGDCYYLPGAHPDWEEAGARRLAARGPFEKGAWRRGDTLLVPLRDQDGELRGLIRLGSPIDGAKPSLATVQLLGVFATHAVVAIDNALEHEQLQQVTGDLEEQLRVRHDLTEMSRTLLANLDQTAVFNETARVLGQLVPHQFLAIGLRNGHTDALTPVFATGEEGRVTVERGEVVSHPSVQAVLADGRPVLLDEEGSMPVPSPFGTADGSASLILAPLATSDRVFGVLGVGRDVADPFGRRELELTVLVANLAAIAVHNARTYQEMQLLAVSDGLTGLHNYRHFQETLAAEVRRADRYEETFCLLMMDLDHFKAVNDTIGHQKGDEVLRSVTDVLRQCSRDSDYIARYGGEEFVMILPRTTLSEAHHVAERIRVRVREIDAGSPALQVSMSIGVAAYPDSVSDMDGVLRAADAALLRAKAGGRNRIQLHGEPPPDVFEPAHVHHAGLAREFCRAVGLDDRQASGVMLTLSVADQVARSAGARSAGSEHEGAIHGIGVRWDGRGADDDAFAALLYSTERWDGAGYPEGLAGEEIPLPARVFAVCRAYLEAVDESDDPAVALERLWRSAGDELDPHLVQRFIAHVRREEQERQTAASAAGA